MIIYKNTFENIKTLNCDFPIEDKYYANDLLGVVADGITRDPIGVSDLSKLTLEEMLKLYPRPSGAEIVAQTVVDSFKDFNNNLLEQFIKANEAVKQLNDKYIANCDYLQNDYYGTVSSAAYIDNNILHYAYICDCGVIVYDKEGNVKFKTEDDKESISDPYINNIGIGWHLPEARVIVRRDYRNNLGNIKDGLCISYGALTGEESAINFIRTGSLEVDESDTIVVYTDGLSNILKDNLFIKNILNFNELDFTSYINNKSESDYELYGKEKTLIIMKK